MPISLTSLATFRSDGSVHIVVESPRGSSVKFKYDSELKAFSISRPLPTGLVYPHDWGFVPSTCAPDGDPLDAMILWDRPSFPGVVIACRLIGLLRVEQNNKTNRSKREANDRVVALPVEAPQFDHLKDISDFSERQREELEAFFLAATAFEKKDPILKGWGGARAAHDLVQETAIVKV